MTPFRIFERAPYSRRFSRHWWRQLWEFVTWGLWRDLCDFYLRGRYGWCPSDTLDFGVYISRVIGGGLKWMAENTAGAPTAYGYDGLYQRNEAGELEPWDVSVGHHGPLTDFDKWRADLMRWGTAIEVWAEHDGYDICDQEGSEKRAEEMEKAYIELTPWIAGLWW